MPILNLQGLVSAFAFIDLLEYIGLVMFFTNDKLSTSILRIVKS